MNLNDKIYIAGSNGMVGSAIIRKLKEHGYTNLLTSSRDNFDLQDPVAVFNFFINNKPDYVFMAAAKVGGIGANKTNPLEFLKNNLQIQNNLFSASNIIGVKKVCFLGSSCIYPRECPQPMKEEYLLTGKLEPTNEGYALAKIVGLKMAEYYDKQYSMKSVCPMPCNLYGTKDHFDLQVAHVLSALVKRFVDAKKENLSSITLWGTGIAKREFMHVDDAAEAAIFLMNNYDSSEIINVGWGKDITIKELALTIANEVDFTGEIIWDSSKPDGMLRKCLDVSKITALGFKPKISLEDGIRQTIKEYKELK